jgi:cation transport regulator ChaB
LITDLHNQGQEAKDTQKSMDDYAKEYVATQTNNFLEGKQDADDYIASLENIPKEINTTVTTTYRDKQDNRGDDSSQQSPGRASGGPVDAGQAYLVGEHGPETIVPAADGYVLTASETRRAQASGAQLGASRGGSIVTQTTIINVDARGSSLTMADITHGVHAALESVGRSADTQVRTLG